MEAIIQVSRSLLSHGGILYQARANWNPSSVVSSKLGIKLSWPPFCCIFDYAVLHDASIGLASVCIYPVHRLFTWAFNSSNMVKYSSFITFVVCLLFIVKMSWSFKSQIWATTLRYFSREIQHRPTHTSQNYRVLHHNSLVIDSSKDGTQNNGDNKEYLVWACVKIRLFLYARWFSPKVKSTGLFMLHMA